MQIRWIGIAAALIAIYGAGLLYEMIAAPAGCCGLTWPSPDPNQAERIAAADDPRGLSAAVQKRTALAILAARPGEPTAWIRLAYADVLEQGHMTDAAKRALDTSYLIAPYGGPGITPARLAFALQTWPDLLHSTRLAAMREVAISNGDYDVHAATVQAVRNVTDPAGRLAATLLGLGPAAPR